MEKKMLWKRVLIILACVAGGLVAVAIVLGVLNAVVADGAWTFGWTDYRYDETDYEIGNGSIPYGEISQIEIDWIDGMVCIEACKDDYISLSEEADGELHDSVKLRWCVSEDGTLSVKYRKSAYYFGTGNENRNKQLVVRIPERLFDGMQRIELSVASSNVMVKNVKAKSFDLETNSGNFIAEGCEFNAFSAETVSGAVVYNGVLHNSFEADSKSGSILLIADACPAEVEIETASAAVKLQFLKDISMTVNWTTKSGKLTSDISLSEKNGAYVAGEGSARVSVQTVSGDCIITEKEAQAD